MKIKCDLTLEYTNTEKTKKIHESIKVDNYDFVKTEIKGKKIQAEIQSKSISSMIHTLDDLLGCITVAEKIVDKS